MDPMPLAGMFCATVQEALAAPVFPLTWVHCSECGVVQVLEDISDASLFAKYNYASSTVPGLVRHFASYADFLAIRYADNPNIRFLEIGCNDGVLLNKLPATWQLLGFDPSDVAALAAKQNSGYRLFPIPFSEANVKGKGLEDSVDVISGSNCLAHISDLRDVFEGVWSALRFGGHFWVEVHDLDELVRGGQWDTIYHEHKVEWSERSLVNCLVPLGFDHKETQRTPMHGGALRILFQKVKQSKMVGKERRTIEPGLKSLELAYRKRYETPAAAQLLSALEKGDRIAAYGAAGRANVYLNQMPQLKFDYIVDESPLRMNKFIPKVATPIVSPSSLTTKPATACLVTAWNYREDIIRKNPAHKGLWLTAFGDV
jgi:SAM-dependent methyltransferase